MSKYNWTYEVNVNNYIWRGDVVNSKQEATEKGILPKEVSKEQALEIYKKATIEGCETEEEKIEQFKKEIDLNNKLSIRYGDNRYVLLLIDGSLL